MKAHYEHLIELITSSCLVQLGIQKIKNILKKKIILHEIEFISKN